LKERSASVHIYRESGRVETDNSWIRYTLPSRFAKRFRVGRSGGPPLKGTGLLDPNERRLCRNMGGTA